MDHPEQNLIALSIETRYGIFTAHFSDVGLAGLDFPNKSSKTTIPENPSPELEVWRKQTEEALQRAMEDGRIGPLPPLDLRKGSNFQKRVWEALQAIAPGQTLTYGELAAAIYQPKAMRAVGRACGANPIPVLIPCHRILAANRKLGGFSGGLKWKELLLTLEGHTDFAALTAEMSLFGQQRSSNKTK